ncbi:glycoside hydrolase family 13 protein [Leifsonia sp. F6_8S_P_1B]|uniref:Glycoside hydrolase family 13 protein n=1 Tax=Leifsonia williamsii TaxID=3035919 RepID=A0ABT8K9B8_9MICO|nr:glycoside hydrolase family 13 protein [Leifsonia williamsii]MDN4614070.1 glycoside hydrolase family 13 protein [Leifsonia williamsii]
MTIIATTSPTPSPLSPSTPGREWWRSAVIYQVYPRSFADANGDGIGDLPGITRRLPALAELGVDAVWLSPFQTSPQRDAGYDVADYCDVDPLFGTLADFDALLDEAHGLGLRVIIDLVPNHSSSDHTWFQEALAAGPGSPERARYIFREGQGEHGELPPNNWESIFGGPAWTRITEADGQPGQWYLHLFDKSQPDLDWENPWVWEQFRGILRFWLDRGVDGFRVDVAHGMIKEEGLPDYTPPAGAGSMTGAELPTTTGGIPLEPEIAAHAEQDPATPPYFGQDGVHEIYRDWHKVLEEYEGDRVLCGEAWVEPLEKLARWVRPDEMQQTFNFGYLETPWNAPALRTVIDRSISVFGSVGAPSTWVLSNHDVVRHATRLALTGDNPQGHGIGPKSTGIPDPAFALRRARAATALMLALPGSAYLYQGEELGLPEAIDLPDEARQDPTWFRTGGERYGRDGCRVPIPWEGADPSYGFGPGAASWLPQPASWAEYTRSSQRGVPGSTLTMYQEALAARREHDLAFGELEWSDLGQDTLLFRSGAVTVVVNLGEKPVELPAGEIVLQSGPVEGRLLPQDTTVWLR